MNAAMLVAKERQLDWLLEEVLGPRPAAVPARSHWLAAALVALAIGAAFGVALLRGDGTHVQPAQEPAPDVQWTEAHGPASLAAVPDDVVNLRCFDFDDDALRALPRFTKLERLDLSGTDVNEQGYSVSLKITDAGVTHLGKLKSLRWLSLAGCHDMKGTSLHVLEGVPLLEHLDLTYSGVESPAVERLALLGNLRELVLSHCMNFHGRSLAEVAKSPGLRRLELRACTTLSAKDAMHVAKMTTLRHLDLRDCQGRFRGQTASLPGDGATFIDTDGDGLPDKRVEPPPPPEQDGIGITDEVVAAISALPLETLLLGGSESLTDAIGDSLTKRTTLRSLDLSNLPKTTGALLAKVPGGLDELWIDDNAQFTPEELKQLPPLRALRTLGLTGLTQLDAATLRTLLADKQLTELRLGGARTRGKDRTVVTWSLLAEAGAAVAKQERLASLDLSFASWVDARVVEQVATLKNLRSLDLTATAIGQADHLAPLANAPSLRRLDLTWCEQLDDRELDALAGAHLTELGLYGTNLKAEAVREAARAWPGCVVKMPRGQRYVVPTTR